MADRLPLSLTRAFTIAELLADGPRSFGAVRTALGGLAAPTLSRLLRALQTAELLRKDTAGYRMGPRLERTARRLAGNLDPATLLEPVLVDLAQATSESAAFYTWQGGVVTLRAKREVPESVHYMPVGQQVGELTQHGFAQVIVAALLEHERRACWRRCPIRQRPLAEFLARTAVIRRDGVVIERGEHRPGVQRIAAVVRAGRDGAILGSLGVSTLSRAAPRLQALATEVVQAAATATRLLALTTPPPRTRP